jgi:FKBP-type peptidyl-prolyl cis-trans isomerase
VCAGCKLKVCSPSFTSGFRNQTRLPILLLLAIGASQDTTTMILRLLAAISVVQAWTATTVVPKLHQHQKKDQQPRRTFFRETVSWIVVAGAAVVVPLPANALVKGNTPPPKKKPGERSCTNVEECQQLAEEKEAADREAVADQLAPTSVTSLGTRYKDVITTAGDRKAQPGDVVELYYKVLKLGKRSYDGLSGEGTVVFSRGYGLEDDEETARTAAPFQTVLGGYNTIAALNDAVLGMSVGSIRRFAVTPETGWRKPGKACDGGPGGAGAGGDLKTDYVVVPTATMVATEACFDTSKQPFPKSYAQQRRMAQRFDQSLIMEVELVGVRRPRKDDDLFL